MLDALVKLIIQISNARPWAKVECEKCRKVCFSTAFALVIIIAVCACPITSSAQANNNANASSASSSPSPSPSADTKPKPANPAAEGAKQAEPAPVNSGAADTKPGNGPAATDLSSVRVTGVSGDLALFNTISVTVANLPLLLKAAGNDYSKIVLYVDGFPLKGITPRPGEDNNLKFDLKRTDNDDTKKSWNSLLGRPTLPLPKQKKVSVTVGVLNQPPVDTDYKDDKKFPMTVINVYGYWIFAAALVLFLVLFIRWARHSDVLRVGPRLADGQLQRYSLGRCQMAYWFFLVAASYVFIWMVTSEYGVLPGSVLGLIGISAGTALGAAIIDTSGAGSVSAAAISHPTSGFFTDIFSDDEGKLTFHRFQIVVWSIVLGIIFVASVYNVLTMPFLMSCWH